jgi:SAM-dependent methyltransferase
MGDAVEPLEAVLRRLQDERDEADARYNDALTSLDRALRAPVTLTAPIAALDESQLPALNETWNILPAPPQASGLRAKLTGYIWSVIGPYLQRQLTFNSQLVDHLNRQAGRQRDAHAAAEAAVAALREQLAATGVFQGHLIHYLQQITAYVDTKDRHTAGGALVLNASLSGLAENFAKRFESMAAREHRRERQYDADSAAIAMRQEDLLGTVGTLQHGLMTVKRELERIAEAGTGEVHRGSGTRDPELAPPGNPSEIGRAFAPGLDSYKYVGFEDQFRGSRDTIRARFESYLPLFEGTTDVLDVGCGRGEFLDLLASRGVKARGVDLNHEMAEVCRARGLDVTEADAVGFLAALPDGSLGGLFSAQVVEHLQPGYLLRFLELAFHKLRPGSRLVLETLNPACWVAFFESYIRDITHVWPLHPETLKYLVLASGFTTATVEFRSPVPEQDRLQKVAVAAGMPVDLADLAEAFNGNVDKLNARIFTHLDYVVVGHKRQ